MRVEHPGRFPNPAQHSLNAPGYFLNPAERFLNPAVEWSCITDSFFTPAGEIIVLGIRGEIDLVTLPMLEAALNAHLDQEPAHLIVDLEWVTHCSARGMALLVTTVGYAAGQGVGYAVSGLPAWLDRIWRIFFTDESPVRYQSAATAVTTIEARRSRVLTDHSVRRGHVRGVPKADRRAQRDGRMIRALVAGYPLKSVDPDGLIQTVPADSEEWGKRAASALRRRAEPPIRSNGAPTAHLDGRHICLVGDLVGDPCSHRSRANERE